MSNTFGPGFPTANINPGHIHVRNDNGLLEIFMYLGGDPRDTNRNWLLITGAFSNDPDTTQWNDRQQGSLWYNRARKKYFGWNGRETVQMSNVEDNALELVSLSNDFISGSSTNNLIGAFGLSRSGPGGQDIIPLSVGHAGIIRLRTQNNVAGTPARLHQGSLTNDTFFSFNSPFSLSMVMRLNSIDANVISRFGICNDAANDPPSDGIYFEKLQADTEWFAIIRANDVETRVPTNKTIVADFSQFELRFININTIGFKIDNGTEITVTNQPSSATVQMYVQLRHFTNGQRSIDFDYFNLEFARG